MAIPIRRVRHPRVTHQSATLGQCKHCLAVRLACLRRAASVRSEPGSNSPWLLKPNRSSAITISVFLTNSYFLNWFRMVSLTKHLKRWSILTLSKPYLFFLSFPVVSNIVSLLCDGDSYIIRIFSYGQCLNPFFLHFFHFFLNFFSKKTGYPISLHYGHLV